MLRKSAQSLASPLAKLFTQCFRDGVQPESWKIANVVPIFKKGFKSTPKNYRPISLLSILSKVMEAIINRSITNFLESNQVLSGRQFGFRRGLGTTDLLLSLQHEWSRTSNAGGVTRVLAVDVAGAFDKVSHRGVVHKARCLGLTGHLLS